MAADWAILIVTLKRRRQFFARLMRHLEPQVSPKVNIYTLEDGGVEKIGTKRQRMIEAVKEPYLSFVDDDDVVAPTFCKDILSAISKGPDVVGFRLRYYEDGELRGTSMHSMQAKKWDTVYEPGKLAMHYRHPNHLNPVRTENALAAGFPPLDSGEDYEYSCRLLKLFPNMTEEFIDKELYHYFYRSPMFRAEGENLEVADVNL